MPWCHANSRFSLEVQVEEVNVSCAGMSGVGDAGKVIAPVYQRLSHQYPDVSSFVHGIQCPLSGPLTLKLQYWHTLLHRFVWPVTLHAACAGAQAKFLKVDIDQPSIEKTVVDSNISSVVSY